MSVRDKGGKYMGDFTVAGIRYRQMFPSHAEAEAWEVQSRANLKLGQPVDRRRVSPRTRSPETVQGLLNQLSKVYWVDLAPTAMEKRDVQRFVDFVGPSASPETAFSVEKLEDFAAELKAIGCDVSPISPPVEERVRRLICGLRRPRFPVRLLRQTRRGIDGPAPNEVG